jgi:hypothetical protein
MPSEAAASPTGRTGLAARLGVPLLLIVLIALEIRSGVASLPAWLEGFGVRFEWSPESLFRGLVGVQAGLALSILLLGRWSRRLALATMAGIAFAAIAELSALLGRDVETWRYLVPAILLAVSGAMLPALLRNAPAAPGPNGSVAWRAIGLLAIVTIAFGLAARVPVSPLPGPVLGSFSGEVIELRPESWVGQTIPATGLAGHLPAVTPLTLEGRSAVVLYNPRCASCHELFDEWFADGAPFRVVAIQVPPESSAVLLESDLPEDVECPACERLTLRAGPLWIVQPPVVAAVEDGVVTCVAMRPEEIESCLGRWFGRPATTQAEPSANSM